MQSPESISLTYDPTPPPADPRYDWDDLVGEGEVIVRVVRDESPPKTPPVYGNGPPPQNVAQDTNCVIQ